MALFKRKESAGASESQPGSPARSELDAQGRMGKDRPTPSRREAEAARRERLHPTLSKKEQRAQAARATRSDRMKNLQARDATPEKALLRDHVDARRNVGEFLLPSLVLILGLSFLNAYFPQVTLISTVVMYLFILLVIVDLAMMWRSFKKLLGERLPQAPRQGLMLYGMNRAIQLRRFRVPPPRVKRGERY